MNHSNSMVKLPDGKHNPCYLNIRMTWSETLKLGFQSCIRPWHNSIQGGGSQWPMLLPGPLWPLKYKIADERKWLQLRLWTWGWPTLVLFSFSSIVFLGTQHVLTHPPKFFPPLLLLSTPYKCTIQKENDTSCSRPCFSFFFFGVGRQIFTFFQPEKYDFNTD